MFVGALRRRRAHLRHGAGHGAIPDRPRVGHPRTGDHLRGRARQPPRRGGGHRHRRLSQRRARRAELSLLFRGALDVQAHRITQGMLVAAARAGRSGTEDVVEEVERAYEGRQPSAPSTCSPRRSTRASWCGNPRRWRSRRSRTAWRAGRPRPTAPQLPRRAARKPRDVAQHDLAARREKLRAVFSEGTNETILRACSILADEGIATPILLGREEEVRAAIEELRLDLPGVPIIDPARSPRLETHRDLLRPARQAQCHARGRHPALAPARILRRDNAPLRRRRSHGFRRLRPLRRIAAHHPRSDRDRARHPAGLRALPRAVAQAGVRARRLRVNINPDAEELPRSRFWPPTSPGPSARNPAWPCSPSRTSEAWTIAVTRKVRRAVDREAARSGTGHRRGDAAPHRPRRGAAAAILPLLLAGRRTTCWCSRGSSPGTWPAPVAAPGRRCAGGADFSSARASPLTCCNSDTPWRRWST